MYSDKSDSGSSKSYGYEPNYFTNKKEFEEDVDDEDDDYEFGKKVDGDRDRNAHKVGWQQCWDDFHLEGIVIFVSQTIYEERVEKMNLLIQFMN